MRGTILKKRGVFGTFWNMGGQTAAGNDLGIILLTLILCPAFVRNSVRHTKACVMISQLTIVWKNVHETSIAVPYVCLLCGACAELSLLHTTLTDVILYSTRRKRRKAAVRAHGWSQLAPQSRWSRLVTKRLLPYDLTHVPLCYDAFAVRRVQRSFPVNPSRPPASISSLLLNLLFAPHHIVLARTPTVLPSLRFDSQTIK